MTTEQFDLIWQNKNTYYEHLALSNTKPHKEATTFKGEIDETLKHIENPYVLIENKPKSHFQIIGKRPETDEGQIMTFYNQIHIEPTVDNMEELENDLKHSCELVSEYKVPLVAMVPEQSKNSKQILDKLFQHGFIQSGKGPGMIVDYLNCDEQKVPENLKPMSEKLEIGELKPVDWINRYDDSNEDNLLLKTWCDTLVASYGFFSKESTSDYFYEVFRHARYGSNEALRMFYLNYRETPESKPRMISIASLFIEKDKGVCGLYNVGTIPDKSLRRMGAARLLSHHLVYVIGKNELNLRYCTLQSSKAAFNLYKQIGFKHIGDWYAAVYPDNAHWIIKFLMKVTLLRLAMTILGVRDLAESSSWKKLLAFVVAWFSIITYLIFYLAPDFN